MECKICGNICTNIFSAKVLNRYDISYFQCNTCGFIQTEKVYWLEEAYASAINNNDTGILARNERFKKIVAVLLKFCFDTKSKYLDYAGGYGVFTRMMRDIGFDYYWDDDFAKNLISIGFEHKTGTTYKAITAFEVFEHLDNPYHKIEDMLRYADTIIFSTELVPDNTPGKEWWYFAFTHGQHIAFYHKKTLQFIAAKYNLNLLSNGSNFHVLTKRKINNSYFNILLKLSKYGLYNLVKSTLHTKTFSDHKLMS